MKKMQLVALSDQAKALFTTSYRGKIQKHFRIAHPGFVRTVPARETGQIVLAPSSRLVMSKSGGIGSESLGSNVKDNGVSDQFDVPDDFPAGEFSWAPDTSQRFNWLLLTPTQGGGLWFVEPANLGALLEGHPVIQAGIPGSPGSDPVITRYNSVITGLQGLMTEELEILQSETQHELLEEAVIVLQALRSDREKAVRIEVIKRAADAAKAKAAAAIAEANALEQEQMRLMDPTVLDEVAEERDRIIDQVQDHTAAGM